MTEALYGSELWVTGEQLHALTHNWWIAIAVVFDDLGERLNVFVIQLTAERFLDDDRVRLGQWLVGISGWLLGRRRRAAR